MHPTNENPRGQAGVRKDFACESRQASIAERRGIVLGGPRWRRARGLMTIRDLVDEYCAARAPRGPYRTPLPEDWVGGATA